MSNPTSPLPVKLAQTLEIKDGRLFIDGVLFEYGTHGGFTIGPLAGRRADIPSVTLTVLGMSIRVDHSVLPSAGAPPETYVNPGDDTANGSTKAQRLADGPMVEEPEQIKPAESYADMLPPALAVYTAIVSPDCLCVWRSGVEALQLILDRVDPACPLHGRGAPFDATPRPTFDPDDVYGLPEDRPAGGER